MGRKLLKAVQTITTFRNPLADPVGTRRGPPLVRGPQFENRWLTSFFYSYSSTNPANLVKIGLVDVEIIGLTHRPTVKKRKERNRSKA